MQSLCWPGSHREFYIQPPACACSWRTVGPWRCQGQLRQGKQPPGFETARDNGRASRNGPIAQFYAADCCPRKHRPLLPPIQWHHPAQHSFQIDRQIGIGEQWLHNRRGQQRQAQQASGLRYIDAFGSGNISDRPKLAFIEQSLPAVRQPQCPDQGRVLRRLALA